MPVCHRQTAIRLNNRPELVFPIRLPKHSGGGRCFHEWGRRVHVEPFLREAPEAGKGGMRFAQEKPAARSPEEDAVPQGGTSYCSGLILNGRTVQIFNAKTQRAGKIAK